METCRQSEQGVIRKERKMKNGIPPKKKTRTELQEQRVSRRALYRWARWVVLSKGHRHKGRGRGGTGACVGWRRAHMYTQTKRRKGALALHCRGGRGTGKVAPAAENLFVIMHTATKAHMSLVWVFFFLLSHKQQVTTSRTNQSDKKKPTVNSVKEFTPATRSPFLQKDLCCLGQAATWLRLGVGIPIIWRTLMWGQRFCRHGANQSRKPSGVPVRNNQPDKFFGIWTKAPVFK